MCVGGAVLDGQEGSTAKGPFKLNDTLNVFRYRRERGYENALKEPK